MAYAKEGEHLPKEVVQYKIALCFDEHVIREEDSEAATMQNQPCGAGHGIPLLSAGAKLLTAGMLVATAFLSAGQTQLQSSQQQQPDSVVAVVADTQGLPSVPAHQRPPFGTYWGVCNSLPCLTVPLPCPPDGYGYAYCYFGGLVK